MTNIEYLKAQLGRFGVSSAELTAALITQGLDPNAEVKTKEDVLKARTAMYHEIPMMLAGLQNVSEGDISISWNYEGVKLWYSTLAEELGLDNMLNPKIENASSRW